MECLANLLQKAGVDTDLLKFALGEAQDSLVDTGANRNKALLSFIDQVFISVDDDAIFLSPQDSDLKFEYDERADPFQTTYYQTEDKLPFLDEAITGETDFFSLHEEALACSSKWNIPVPMSVSGILGDSGMATPRLLFSLPDAQILTLTSRPGLLREALSNRKIHRQVARRLVSPQPLVMMPCVAFNNSFPLPPFFPIGRNQDGAYAYLLKACLPGSLVGHIPASILHAPSVSRRYEKDCLQKMEFRVNDLLILLLHEYLTRPMVEGLLRDPFQKLANFLVDQASVQEPDFLEACRIKFRHALKKRGEAISARCERLRSEKTPEMKLWLELAEEEIKLCSKVQTHSNFGIPIDAGTTAKTQEWILLFGRLVKSWTEIRKIAAQLNQNEL